MSRSGTVTARLRLLPLLALALGLGGLALLLAYADPVRLADALASFDTQLLPLLLAIVLADYAVRFWRWRLLVRVTTGSMPPLGPDLACFLAANTLMLTPMRAGDWSRSAYASALFGTPAAQTAPVPLLERVVDVVVMALFAALGTIAFSASPIYALAGLILAVLATAILCSHHAAALVVGLVRRTAGDSLADHAVSFFRHLHALWRPRPLAVAFGLGAAAWLLECLAFYVVLCGLDFQPGIALAGQATFIYPVSNLAGSFSLLPGGIGVAEGSAAGLTTAFVSGASASTALAAGLLIRLAIVGFGVVSGLPGLLYVAGRMGRQQQTNRVVAEGAASPT
ncbi:MAG TPA: lysylphosphatidylglycerol synthase transmembrane domain-containing protein [Dehalococcoidia bacterium]|nr:lysylphosphatidylglycerol synthase transmembrane domain-containing protein [Dehalococcoidia bacterium]